MAAFWKKHLFNTTLIVLFCCFGHTLVAQVKDTAFVHIFKTILSPKCGVSACHDGSFEPNFSTIGSSYNTLVIHPLVKADIGATFKYRVVPKDKKASLLYERVTNCCFVNTNDQMPLMGDKLTKDEIAKIGEWIDNGAKQPDGRTFTVEAKKPDISPVSDILGNGVKLNTIENRKWGDVNGYVLVANNIPSIVLVCKVNFYDKGSNANANVYFEITDSESMLSESIQAMPVGDTWQCTIPTTGRFKKNVQLYYKVKATNNGLTSFLPEDNPAQRQNWSFMFLE